MTALELLRYGLGVAVSQPSTIEDRLDIDPPAGLLQALSERTGVPLADLRMMTLPGWEPMLLESCDRNEQWISKRLAWGSATYDSYVRANSVLLRPGRRPQDPHRRGNGWAGPWRHGKQLDRRRCQVCWTPSHPVVLLVWRLPMVSSCHSSALVDHIALTVERLSGRALESPARISEPVAQLDRYTYQGLRSGLVDLPGRTVHAAVWVRMLRAILDEVSLSASTLPKANCTTITRVWEATGHPYRAGLSVWRPYEHLPPATQTTMMDAAAAAVQLAAAGEIDPRGVLGPALREEPYRPAPAGDERPAVWREAAGYIEELLIMARTSRIAAHLVLRTITVGSRNQRTLCREISWLSTVRHVPAHYYDDYPELDSNPLGDDSPGERITAITR